MTWQLRSMGNAEKDSGSRIRKNSGRWQYLPKSHDFGYGQNYVKCSQANPSRPCSPGQLADGDRSGGVGRVLCIGHTPAASQRAARAAVAWFAALIALVPATAVPAEPSAPGRPNILLIITDQQQAGMLSCAGNRYVKTPAMDSLAAAGTRFERAYVTNPVCGPSRVSMMTGHMPSRFGMRTNDDCRNQVPSAVLGQAVGRLFRAAGYDTAYGGKTHWLKGMTPKSLGFDRLTWDARDELAEACVQFLRTKRDKPFFLVASFINPHDICFMAIDDYVRAEGKETMYPRMQVERKRLAEALRLPAAVSREEFFARICPPLPANFEIPKLEPACISTQYLGARTFRAFVRTHWSDERWRLHRWAYCRLTEMVDAHIAKVLGALRAAGLENSTVVVCTSDHGDLDAAHRLEHKSILYEEAARVPLLVRGKGVARAGVVDNTHLVSVGLDLVPTLCDLAGIEPPAGLPGRSLLPLVRAGQDPSWRDQVVVESRAGRMLRTDRFKYVVYESGLHAEQLIDLAGDPGEMVNLAEERPYRQVLDEHRRRLRRWVQDTGDAIAKPYIR